MARPKGSKNKKAEEPTELGSEAGEVLTSEAYGALYQTVLKHRTQAKEYNGMAAKATQQAAELSGLPPQIITHDVSMESWDAAKRSSYIAARIRSWTAKGWMPEPDLVDQAEGIESFGRRSPMESKAPPPPQTDEAAERVKTNVTRLNAIRELKESTSA